MAQKSQRKSPRIVFKGKVSITFPDKVYQECTAQNLSLIGMWVLGCDGQAEDTPCTIEFIEASETASRSLRLSGKVIRVDDGGIAILFVNMNVRSYNDLESLIIEHAGDTLLEEDAFLDDFTETTEEAEV